MTAIASKLAITVRYISSLALVHSLILSLACAEFQYIHHGESGVVGQSTQQQLQHVKEVRISSFHERLTYATDLTSLALSQSVGDYIVFDRLLGSYVDHFTHLLRLLMKNTFSGAYSVIRLALNSKSLKQVACKIMKASKLRKDLIKDVKREVKILKSLKHVEFFLLRFSRVCV